MRMELGGGHKFLQQLKEFDRDRSPTVSVFECLSGG